jgi:hypothetical protein
MESEIELLRREVIDAFATRPYPGDDLLRRPERDDTGEIEACYRFFRGKHWRDVTLDSILRAKGLDSNLFMPVMSDEAFVYFLPGFLLLSLGPRGDFSIADQLETYLQPPEYFGKDRYLYAPRFDRLVAELSSREKRAVARVLAYLVREDERHGVDPGMLRNALDGYWASFLDA